jgi:integrase
MAGRYPDQLLFTAPGGGVLRNTNFRSRVFTQAKADLGLGTLRIHDLRHTAATLAVSPPAPTSRSFSGCSVTRPRL